jgi:hypothetical protein
MRSFYMRRLPTEYEVNRLIEARKTVFRASQWNIRGPEKSISLDVRRIDTPTQDVGLRLNGRIEAVRDSRPGFILNLYGERIRGCDHSYHHPSYRNGVKLERIKGWHEHLWTEIDRDGYVVIARPPITQQDFISVLYWCLEKWNIEEGAIRQSRLGMQP